MATEVITPVPLAGPGYVGRKSRAYGPGEYRDLKNVVITPQGTLKKRLPVQGYRYNWSGATPINKFIGHWGSDAVLTRYDSVNNQSVLFRRIESNNSLAAIGITNWAAFKTALDTASAYGAGHTHFYIVEGIFQYNNSNYFIVLHAAYITSGTATTYKTKYYIVKGNYNYLHPERNDDITFDTVGLVPFISLSDVVDPDSGANHSSSFLPITSFFMHKDRLVVAVRDTVYLSKATDPQKFSVSDDGAFFKFPGKYLKQVLALGDAIYCIFDNSISYATYNQGPNTDLQVRTISEAVGGEDACTYGNTIYLLKSESIYSIVGTNVSKLIDFEFPVYEGPKSRKYARSDMAAAISPSYKIVAFDDGLYFFSRNHTFFQNNGHTSQTIFKGVSTNLYRLDLNNGHISRYTYTALETTVEAVIKDIFIPSVESIQTDQPAMFILAGSTDNTASVCFSHSPVSYFYYDTTVTGRYDDVTEHGLDSFSVKFGNNYYVRPVPVEIHLSGVTPDELKYYKKKFHSIMIEANVPSWCPGNPVGAPQGGWQAELELNVIAGANLDDEGLVHSSFTPYAAPTFTHLIKSPLFIAPNNSVLGHRYGCLQRANAVDIQIKTRDDVLNSFFKYYDELAPAFEGKNQLLLSIMEIVDISTLWQPTGRKPTGSYLSTDQS